MDYFNRADCRELTAEDWQAILGLSLGIRGGCHEYPSTHPAHRLVSRLRLGMPERTGCFRLRGQTSAARRQSLRRRHAPCRLVVFGQTGSESLLSGGPSQAAAGDLYIWRTSGRELPSPAGPRRCLGNAFGRSGYSYGYVKTFAAKNCLRSGIPR